MYLIAKCFAVLRKKIDHVQEKQNSTVCNTLTLEKIFYSLWHFPFSKICLYQG